MLWFGSAIALTISDIPFNGPTAGVNVGYVGGQFIINPSSTEKEKSDLNLTLAGTATKITMIEAGANELPDDKMLEAIKEGHKEIKKVCEFIEKIRFRNGKTKIWIWKIRNKSWHV